MLRPWILNKVFAPRVFFFHDMITAQPASPLLYGFDTIMGALHIRQWFRKDADKLLQQLLDTNASRVQGDVEQRVVESRLRLESDVRKLLREVRASAEHALSKVREPVVAGTNAVQKAASAGDPDENRRPSGTPASPRLMS